MAGGSGHLKNVNRRKRRTHRFVALGAAMSMPLTLAACGDGDGEYPSESIEYIIPYQPGGGADPAGRQFTEQLDEELGSNSNVVNTPGGDESIGITDLSNAEPDGYTLGMGTSAGFIAQPMINDDAQYQGAEDFTPLARMTATPYGLFVAPDSEYETLDDLLEAAEEDPGSVQISSPVGMGNPAFSLYFLEDQADVEFNVVVTSGGTGEAALEVMSGRLDAVIGNASGQLGLVEAGDLRALAYSGSADYSEFLPDAESFEDAGYDIPFTSDYMTFAPAGLPDDVHSTLDEASESIMNSDEWSEWASNQGALADTLTGDELETYVEDIQANIEAGIDLANERDN